MIKKYVTLVFFALFIISCGGPSAIQVKPGALTSIKNVAILTIDEPLYQMMDHGSSTPWGAAAAASDAKDIKPKFVALLKKENFAFNQALTTALHQSLKKAGYKTFNYKVQRTEKGKLLSDYSKYQSTKVDALLDIVPVSAGYVVENVITSNHWRPEAKVQVRLVDSRSGNVLYQHTMMYGYHNPFMSGVDIDAPEKFHFANREDIFKAGNKVIVAGLQDAVNGVARQIASELKK